MGTTPGPQTDRRYVLVEHHAIPGSGGLCMECGIAEYTHILVDLRYPVPMLDRVVDRHGKMGKGSEPRSLVCLCAQCVAHLGVSMLEVVHL